MKTTIQVTCGEATLSVTGHYHKGSEPVYYPTDKADPGASSEFEIEKVEIVEGKLLDVMMAMQCTNKITKSESGFSGFVKTIVPGITLKDIEDSCIEKIESK